jgi:glycosyltransferase involved in cell wall biosynthesis
VSRALRIAIAKPEWGVRGGFEIVLDRISEHLRAEGHRVDTLAVAAGRRADRIFGWQVTDVLRDRGAELVRYLTLLEAFEQLDTHRADVVISTQPPSFATPAARHLSIFYHHARLFYDLADLAAEAGMLDASLVDEAVRIVRSVDEPRLADVTWFLAGSPTVRRRLATFNDLRSNVGLFAAGVGVEAMSSAAGIDPSGHALCVSRHEFPKRTELFVEAMMACACPAVCVGSGGRLGHLKQLASSGWPDPVDSDLPWWRSPAPWVDPEALPSRIADVTFESNIGSERLAMRYATASCVVAPAYDEDYGLTALEAMAHGRPVIVCADGGGLCDLVVDGVNGLVVEPDPAAIARAVERLRGDPDLAEDLGRKGREVASTYTWANAFAQLDDGIERVISA